MGLTFIGQNVAYRQQLAHYSNLEILALLVVSYFDLGDRIYGLVLLLKIWPGYVVLLPRFVRGLGPATCSGPKSHRSTAPDGAGRHCRDMWRKDRPRRRQVRGVDEGDFPFK